jgi:hypothetical protein
MEICREEPIMVESHVASMNLQPGSSPLEPSHISLTFYLRDYEYICMDLC